MADKVLKPLGVNEHDEYNIKKLQRSIDEILDVAREAIKVERGFMVMIPYPDMGFIRFELPVTERVAVVEVHVAVLVGVFPPPRT